MNNKLLFFLSVFLMFSSYNYAQKRVINNFKIQGNKKLKSSIINTIAKVRNGLALDSLMLEEDIKQLKRLSSISHANYEINLSENEDECEVTYVIEENLTIIPSLNIFNSYTNDLAFKVALFEFNLLGLNMAVSGFYEDNVRSSYGLNFRAPYLFNDRWGIGLNFQKVQAVEPLFENKQRNLFNYGNDSCEVLGLYQMNFNNRFELGVNYFFESYEQINDQSVAGIPEQLNTNKTAFLLGYEHTTLDYKYQYVSGFLNKVNIEYIRSSDQVLKTFGLLKNDFSYFKRIRKKGNFAHRIRFGFSNNDSLFTPFFVDNNLNIRGAGNIVDRGSGIIVLNSEYRHTLIEKGWFVLQGNAFIDSGTLINSPKNLEDSINKENIRVYSGLGLRFIHKSIFNAIFRIDYGVCLTASTYNNSQRGLVFGIGQYF